MSAFRLIFIATSILLNLLYAKAQNLDTSRSSDTIVPEQAVTRIPEKFLKSGFIPYYDLLITGSDRDTILYHQSFYTRLINTGEMGLNKKGIITVTDSHIHPNKDVIFYVLLGIIMLLAVTIYFFDDYFIGYLRSFGNYNYRLSQTPERQARMFIPAFLLNLLFVINGGFFLALLTQDTLKKFNLWELWSIGSSIIGGVYIFKFLVLHFFGYLFRMRQAISIYIHIVFLVNKMIGILLVPVLWVVAFSNNPDTDSSIQNIYNLLIIILVLLMIYRYLVSFIMIKNNFKINGFHFFVYLCATEILPLLVSYKFLTEQIRFLV